VYIYLIRQENSNYYKIGKSVSPKSRIKTLQDGNPVALKLIHSTQCADNGFLAELAIHSKFKNYYVQGEWFEFKDNQIANVIEQMNQYASVLSNRKPDKGMCDIFDWMIRQPDFWKTRRIVIDHSTKRAWTEPINMSEKNSKPQGKNVI